MSTDSVHLLLPIEPNKTKTGTAKKWVPGDSLEGLVVDFEENIKKDKKQKITSIPDIWAAPKAFASQLFKNPKMDSAERINWRAVLAIVALRNVMGFDLEIKRVEVDLDPKSYKTQDPFLQVVSRLIATEFKKKPDDDKAVINLVSYHDKVIALIWPNSVIYPVVPYADRELFEDIVWWDKNRAKFLDPSKTDDISPEIRFVLTKWLADLKEYVAKGNTEYKNDVGVCIQQYINDLSSNVTVVGYKNQEVDTEFNVEGYGDVIFNKKYVISAKKENLKASRVLLAGKKDNEFIYVIDKAVAEAWEMKPSQVFCFSTNKLGLINLDRALSIINDEEKRKEIIDELRGIIQKDKEIAGGLDKPNSGSNTTQHFEKDLRVRILTADDFFTDKIAYVTGFVAGANPFPNSLTETDIEKDARKTETYGTGRFCKKIGQNLQDFILPIHKEVLEFMNSNELVSNIEIERESRLAPIKVTIKLELLCKDDGTRRTLFLTRQYERDKTVNIKRSDMPNVQVWPNYECDLWKQYYLFNGAKKDPKFVIEPDWSEPAENENTVINTESLNIEIRRYTSFPYTFVCKSFDKNTKKYEEVGLICIAPKVKKIINNNKTIRIGVDFGTTNTVVYYKEPSDENANVMAFENRTFEITQQSDSDKQNLRRYFFPAERQPETDMGTIRTIFHEFPSSNNNPKQVPQRPLEIGNIYFLEKYSKNKNENSEGTHQSDLDDLVIVDELKTNIKWDDEPNNENRVHGFLYQLCLQATAEAVEKGAEKIIWHFSWPSALSISKKNRYSEFWVGGLVNVVNHICSTEICDSKKVCRKTESVAMADYFHKGLEGSKQGKALIKGVLTIDIGGGSTDISVRKGEDKDKTLIEIHQCSFKFAGNDIFSNYVKCKYKTKNDLLSPLGRYDDSLQGELEKLSSFAKNTQWKAFELELEFILKNFDTELKKGMDVANQNTEIGKGLNIVMRDIAFSLGGIFFYAGAIIAYELEKQDSAIENYFPECFVGGNGSKLLDWASKGEFSKDKNIEKLLNVCVVVGMMSAKKIIVEHYQKADKKLSTEGIVIRQSELPKREVAFGLLCGSAGESVLKDSVKEEVDIGEDDYTDFLNASTNAAAPSLGDSSSEYSVYSGEMYYMGDAWKFDQKLTASNFLNKNEYINLKYNETDNMFLSYCRLFDNIISKFNLFNDEKVLNALTRNEIKENIVLKVMELLEEKKNQERDNIIVEPIFIMELREAMKILSNK